MRAPYWSDDQVTLYLGDALDVLREMEPASVDAIVTDPPYGLEFMGKEWDAPWQSAGIGGNTSGFAPTGFTDGGKRLARPSFLGSPNPSCRACGGVQRGREGKTAFRKCVCEAPDFPNVALPRMRAYQEWCEAWARECLRVLKPGGFMLAMGGSRTWHRLACAVEDAGFEIRDTITWHYGAGFPKSRDVSKDLRALPPCSCGGASLRGEGVCIIEPASPASPVRAGVGTEAVPVPIAGQPAHGTRGVGTDVGAHTPRAFTDMQGCVEGTVGNGQPVVLGPAPMAIDAERDEVGEVVRGVEADPEPLRDQVVGDEPGSCSAVGTAPIPGDDLLGDGAPSESLVLPFAAAPSRVSFTAEPAPVSDRHTGARAVDGLPRSVADSAVTADGAGEGLHDLKCKACGGVRRHLIPDGLGTALKPATEFIVVARKPLAGTVAANVLEHGTGALNIAGCRLAHGDEVDLGHVQRQREPSAGMSGLGESGYAADHEQATYNAAGRWPPNVLLGPEAAAELDRQSGVRTSGDAPKRRSAAVFGDCYGEFTGQPDCPPGRAANEGGASRFFPVFKYENVCVLYGTLSVCERVSGAAATSPPPGQRRDAAASDASDSLSQQDAARSALSTSSAPTAGSPSATMPGTTAGTAPEAAGMKSSDWSALRAASAGSLCGSCATAIAQSLAATQQGRSPMPTLGLPSTDAFSERILTQNLALCAEALARYGTTSTTTGLTTSLGCAVAAISACTTKESDSPTRRSGPSPFRYAAKAGSFERPRNSDGTAHPTVKPRDLIAWLVRLVSTPGALILDPFAGSGTTGEACVMEGRRCVLIEQHEPYAELAKVRLSKPIQPGMFDLEAS